MVLFAFLCLSLMGAIFRLSQIIIIDEFEMHDPWVVLFSKIIPFMLIILIYGMYRLFRRDKQKLVIDSAPSEVDPNHFYTIIVPVKDIAIMLITRYVLIIIVLGTAFSGISLSASVEPILPLPLLIELMAVSLAIVMLMIFFIQPRYVALGENSDNILVYFRPETIQVLPTICSLLSISSKKCTYIHSDRGCLRQYIGYFKPEDADRLCKQLALKFPNIKFKNW